MPNTDDYLKRYNERTQGNGYQPSSATDDYYQMAKNQEYDLLFDKEVALENAKANAMKYTQNTINAQGFGSTGYGNTLQSGIYNTYLNRANEAQVNYANNIRDINQQQMQADEAKANDRFASVTTMLQGADGVDNMNQLLADYGYIKKDDKGNIVYGDDGNVQWTRPEGMSDDDWYQMQYYYRMQKNAFDQEGVTSYNFTTKEGLLNYLNTALGRTDTEGNPQNNFPSEANTLWNNATAGNIDDNGVIAVTNSQNNVVYVKWTSNGFVKATESDYENAKSKYSVTYTGKQNETVTFKKDN